MAGRAHPEPGRQGPARSGPVPVCSVSEGTPRQPRSPLPLPFLPPLPPPACPHHLPPRPALKGVLGFLRFLMNPGWAARKMWGRDVRRPVASPASPSSPSWAGALPRHRGNPPGGQPGNAACLCPRRRRSWTKAGKRPLVSAQIRTAPRSQALSTIPPSLSLAWVRIARRESVREPMRCVRTGDSGAGCPLATAGLLRVQVKGRGTSDQCCLLSRSGARKT